MQNLVTYQNLEEINIITFWKISGDSEYHLMDLNHLKGKEYSEEEVNALKDSFVVLYDEYFKYKDNANQKNNLKTTDKRTKEEFKIDLLKELHKALQLIELSKANLPLTNYFTLIHEVFTEVKKLDNKFVFNSMENLNDKVKRLEETINILETQLKLNNAENKEVIQKDIVNFYDNIANVEAILERSIGDIKQINALQWLAYEKQADKIIKQKTKK